jgi:hypothetical protein
MTMNHRASKFVDRAGRVFKDRRVGPVETAHRILSQAERIVALSGAAVTQEDRLAALDEVFALYAQVAAFDGGAQRHDRQDALDRAVCSFEEYAGDVEDNGCYRTAPAVSSDDL